MILSNMLWVPQEGIKNVNDLRERLTVIPKYDNLNPIETFVEKDGYFGIPRNFMPVPEDCEDQRVTGSEAPIEFNGILRPMQEKVIQDWLALYRQGITDYIIQLQTGSGKTVVALKIASILRVPFLVIVPRERLLGQWMDEIKKFTTIQDVGRIQQNECDYEGKAACVGMVHSICKDKYPEDFKNHFGLVVYDEMQTLGAETFSEVAKMFPAKYRLANSATIYRQDGMHDTYFYHLGKNIVTSETKTQPNPKIFVHKYNGNSGPLPFWLDRTDAVKTRACILSNLAKNSERNKLIANFADVLMQKGLQTLVIGDRIAQLQEIENYLHRKGYYDIGLYISKTSDKKKRWLEKNGRCILATTKMLDIGIDIDTLRGLVFATPQSEVEQVVGRVRRINPNVPEPTVIDIHDTYEESKRWARKRMKYYEREGFEVNEVDSP